MREIEQYRTALNVDLTQRDEDDIRSRVWEGLRTPGANLYLNHVCPISNTLLKRVTDQPPRWFIPSLPPHAVRWALESRPFRRPPR